jgi:hypothetical protein
MSLPQGPSGQAESYRYNESITDFAALSKLTSELRFANLARKKELEANVNTSYFHMSLDKLRNTKNVLGIKKPRDKWRAEIAYLHYLYRYHDIDKDITVEQWLAMQEIPKKITEREVDVQAAQKTQTFPIAPFTNRTEEYSKAEEKYAGAAMYLGSLDTLVGANDAGFDQESTIDILIAHLDKKSLTAETLTVLDDTTLQYCLLLLFDPVKLAHCAVSKDTAGNYILINFKDPQTPETLTITSNNSKHNFQTKKIDEVPALIKLRDNKTALEDKIKDINTFYQNKRELVKDKVEPTVKQTSLEQIPGLNVPAELETTDTTQAQAPKLNITQVKERIKILEKKGQKNTLLSVVEFFGFSREKIYALLANDQSVPTAKLNISIFGIFSAMLTISRNFLTNRKAIYDRLKTGEQSKEHAVKAPSTINREEEEKLLFQRIVKNQNTIHEKNITQYKIKETLNIGRNNGIYLAPNTQVTVSGKDKLTFFKDTEAKQQLETKKQATENNGSTTYKYVVEKPCFLLHDSVDKGILTKNIKFEGQMYYSNKKSFAQFSM